MSSRLSHAIDAGVVQLPANGNVVVFGGGADASLKSLPKDRTQVVQRFFPDHKDIQDSGYEPVLSPAGSFAMAIVRIPRSRDAARARIAEARAATDGPIVVDGAKTDGIESLLKELRSRATVGAPFSKAHGKVFVVEDGDFSDWVEREKTIDGFTTIPGVFSSDGIDTGSRLLADALPTDLKGHVVDLGAGWGYLAAAVLASPGVTCVDLVEADARALECARLNVSDTRARFHWADATRFESDKPYDAAVMNPPFHSGRASDPEIGRAFIRSAAGLLARHGVLWLVANRHLPYERTLDEHFVQFDAIGGDAGFKLFRAARPRGRSRS